tara:strand:- start:2403 stop:3167 length:765 start_codon:yes stop_codon:yes gene_type:complete
MKNKIFDKKSPYQKIEVFEKDNLGKALYLNGIEQFSEFDEHVYHEVMAGVPLAVNKKPKNILVIGGGDGGIARECLKNSLVESIDVCEIDKNVFDICKEYFPQISCSFDDPKVNIFYEDGSLFLKNANKKYDVIIVDSTDPDETSDPLFGEEFYKNLSLVSKQETIITLQFEGCFFNNKRLNSVLSSIYQSFKFIDFFRCEYERGLRDEYTTFCLCSQSDFSRPTGMEKLFEFDNQNYNKIKNFKKRINWINNE